MLEVSWKDVEGGKIHHVSGFEVQKQRCSIHVQCPKLATVQCF